MVCEYEAIYGQKPSALLLHRRIKTKGSITATMLGVPRAQLEQKMPRAALEYLLTKKSKNGKYPVYDPETDLTSSSSVSDPEREEVLRETRPLGEEEVTSILEKLKQCLIEKLDALPGDDIPPAERDALVNELFKDTEGPTLNSGLGQAIVSTGARRKRAPWI